MDRIKQRPPIQPDKDTTLEKYDKYVGWHSIIFDRLLGELISVKKNSDGMVVFTFELFGEIKDGKARPFEDEHELDLKIQDDQLDIVDHEDGVVDMLFPSQGTIKLIKKTSEAVQ